MKTYFTVLLFTLETHSVRLLFWAINASELKTFFMDIFKNLSSNSEKIRVSNLWNPSNTSQVNPIIIDIADNAFDLVTVFAFCFDDLFFNF